MTRILLALLALFGIVAQSAPAEARLRGETAQVRLVGSAVSVSTVLAARPALSAPQLIAERRAVFVPGIAPVAAPFAVPVPTVLIKVDRARQ